MERIRRDVYNLLTVLFVGAIVAAGSIVVFRTTLLKDMPLSEDGFYEIYTAYDYERFWRKVESQDFIDGRLMADITLNDLSGYDDWESCPPVPWSFAPEEFEGDFDGNGHTIYGLYDDRGYGIVKKNRGRIHDLTIRNSMILGYDSIGGICQWNNGVIEGCVFGGEFRSRQEEPGMESRMAGICEKNEGIITECGYRGTMTIKSGWLREGVRAGICAENHGQVRRCYNLVGLNYYTSAGYCYAIADTGVEDCFVGQESGWDRPGDTREQTAQLDGEEAFYLPFAVRREMKEQYQEGLGFPQCIRQGAEIHAGREEGKGRKERKEIFWEEEESADNRIFGKEALAQEQIKDFVREAFGYKGEGWKDLRLEELSTADVSEVLKVSTDGGLEALSGGAVLPLPGLRILDGGQEIKILAYGLESGLASACEELSGAGTDERSDGPVLWKVCEGLLGIKEAERWEHDTWQLLGGSAERPEGWFVLYSTREGEKGFFYKKEGMLYQVSAKEAGERSASLGESISEKEDLWEALLWSIWENRVPGDGICWQESVVKEAAYGQAQDHGREVLSAEQIMSLESLELCSYEEVKTLEDLQNFPHLTRLSVDALEEINFDLTRDMTPELKELSVKGIFLSEKELKALGELQKLETLRLADCGVTELSFLEKLPKLTGLFLERNEINDISPIAGLGSLETLSLWENQVEDVAPLAGLGALRDLDLSENRIMEIEALAGLTDLRRLELSGNRIRDISPLSGMKKMEELRLSGNLIEDYGALSDMRELYILAVENNPGQEIGKAVFTPLLSAGKYCSVKEEEVLRAQAFLDAFYPEQEIRARELAEGDLNGDGIMDAAVTGLSEGEQGWLERYIYPFLGQADKSFQPIEPLEIDWIYAGDIYDADIYDADACEDTYQGMLIAEEMLVVCLGGYECDSRWSRTETYIYRDKALAESWRVEADWYGTGSEAYFTLYNREKGIYRDYVIARDERGHGEVMLLSEENSLEKSDGGKLQKRLEEGLRELEDKAGYTLPEIYEGALVSQLSVWLESSYGYVMRGYAPKTSPGQALKQAADVFLEDAAALPVTCYTSEEIKENHDRLAGVELPRDFYIGWWKDMPAILAYYACDPGQEGGYVHSFALRQCNEEHTGWIWGGMIYFYENTGKLVIE